MLLYTCRGIARRQSSSAAATTSPGTTISNFSVRKICCSTRVTWRASRIIMRGVTISEARHSTCHAHQRQYLHFSTKKASKLHIYHIDLKRGDLLVLLDVPLEDEDEPGAKPGKRCDEAAHHPLNHLITCQYLYCCTSKASKVSTSSSTTRLEAPRSFSNRSSAYVSIRQHTSTYV